MKTFLKVLALGMSFALTCGAFTSCGDSSSGETGSDGKVYQVGIVQQAQHTALDSATQGFEDALKEKLGDQVEVVVQNASGDSANCATIANQFVSSGKDLIMTNGSQALQATVSATEDIPIVATSITDYATALNIDLADWTGKTGINVTGTADLAPLDQQADMFEELLPDAQTVGILYCSGEANSKFQVEEVTKALEAKGVTVNEYSFSDSNDIAAVATKAVGECDALYVPTDNKVADNTSIVNNIAEPAGVPIIAGEEGICQGCGIATLSISYYDIGYMAGEMAYDILVNGKDPADMEIQYYEDVEKKYMKDRCEALGIEIPSDYQEIVVEN